MSKLYLNFIKISIFSIIIILPAVSAAGPTDQTVNLLLTANLNGGFTTSIENQDNEDPMLVLAQALFKEQEKRSVDLMIDLGNAFYPGLLSRYSHGSVMMDYLDYLGFAATLVSSSDLNIGLGNLEFLTQNKKTTLLSANIEKNGHTVFAPYFTSFIKGKKFAFIGVTSQKGFLDVAEKQLFDANFTDINNVLSITTDKLRLDKTDFIVVLSGLSYEENLALMEKHKAIALCISGGDAQGELFSSKASRVDIESGRSLITLTQPDGYYTLSLSAGEQLQVNALKQTTPVACQVHTQVYKDFVKRLTLWKSQFASEGDQTLAENIPEQISVSNQQAAEMLRHRYGVEVVILEKQAIAPGTLSGRVTYSDILTIVNDDFPIFTYRITGAELKKVMSDRKNLVAAGTDGELVQGYSISDKRDYLICSTQPVYDRITKQSGREIKYKNTWKSISDELRSDLKTERVIAQKDFDYLDRRMGVLVDVYLSNFFDQSQVSRGDKKDVPPGKPSDSYTKWGIEDKIDFTIYNKYHKLILTPYIYFVSLRVIDRDDEYLQNQLRGTLVYTYNIDPNFKPYHKSQVDTVVQKVEEKRPLMFRETAGALFESKYLNGKLGLGFEKQTQDPEKEMFAGFEGLADSKIELWQNINYTFNLDSFYGFQRSKMENRQLRAEITNALSFKFNSLLALSAKHKWSYFDSMEYKQKYTESLFLVALDVTTDFKLF